MVCYNGMVCQYGMMLVSQGIVGYDMVYYTCMHDLEVETHVHDVKVSGMAMMLVYVIQVVYGMVMILKS